MSGENSQDSSEGQVPAWRSDLPASIVVFLVALPLCMGIAIASGVPVAAGLITGIIGGIVVGLLAGAPLQVSGPAAGLTVIVYQIVQEFGLEMLGLTVLLAGLLQVVAGLLGIGQWFRAVSPAVIKGMLAGIGVLIFASQFHVMVDDKPKGSGLQNLVTIPSAVVKGLNFNGFDSPEVRRAHTDALRALGELHRRQAHLSEQIVERLPDHTSEEDLEAQPALLREAGQGDIRDLAEEQRAIQSGLDEIVAELARFEEDKDTPEHAAAITSAAALAQEANVLALADVTGGNVDGAIATQEAAVAAFDELLGTLKNHDHAAQLGILTILVLLAWQSFAPKKLKPIPAPLVAVVVSSAAAVLLTIPVLYVEVPDNLWEEVRLPTLAILGDAPWGSVIKMAFVVALVASAETLLCAAAVDQMQTITRTKYDKELFAQGVGNTLCGLVGALPMTGVIVRSTANIQAGGRTRLSAFLHGIWLLVFVAGLSFLLRGIPTAGLAAILVFTGWKLMNWRSILDLKKYGWGEVAIYAATVSTIVAVDLLSGVILGVALSAAKLLWSFSHLQVRSEQDPGSKKIVLRILGSATFLRLPRLASALEGVPPDTELHVDFANMDYIDHACLDLLMSWARQHESAGGTLVIDWESLHSRFSQSPGGSVPEARQAG